MIYKIQFIGSQNFTDGNILPDTKKFGDIIEVDEVTFNQIVNSGGQVEVLERRVPPSTVKIVKETVNRAEEEVAKSASVPANKRPRNAKGHFIKAKE